jgi:hypothetical protein
LDDWIRGGPLEAGFEEWAPGTPALLRAAFLLTGRQESAEDLTLVRCCLLRIAPDPSREDGIIADDGRTKNAARNVSAM